MKSLHHRLLLLCLCAGTVPAFVGLPKAFAMDEASDELMIQNADMLTLTQEEMEGDRAAQGENNVVSTQSLAATTSGNTLSVAGSLVNGNISMGDQFGGSGFGSYVMNTGNNSTLTAATAVTIQMGPTP